MKKLLAATVLAASVALTASFVPAQAGDDDYVGGPNVPRDQWLATSAAIQKIEAQGFKVHEIEADDGVFEFEATNSAGARVEGHAHPATGDVMNTHPDND
jgi:hypothetical protein